MLGSGTILLLLCSLLFFLDLNFANSNTECTKNHVKTLTDKMEVSWKLDKGKVVFRVTVHGMLDKNLPIQGWIALGFMTSHSGSPPKQKEVAADFVVGFLKSKKNIVIQDCNTITDKKKISYDKQQNYNKITKFINITRHHNRVVFGIARTPNTADKEDVPFGDDPVWMITSYGMDAIESCNKLRKSNIFDNKEFMRVCVLPLNLSKSSELINSSNNPGRANSTDTNAKPSWTHKAAQLAQKHWVGVIVGLAGAVTLVSVVVVYCMCRKPDTDGYNKKVMSFYKQRDDDDEARISMLSAQMS